MAGEPPAEAPLPAAYRLAEATPLYEQPDSSGPLVVDLPAGSLVAVRLEAGQYLHVIGPDDKFGYILASTRMNAIDLPAPPRPRFAEYEEPPASPLPSLPAAGTPMQPSGQPLRVGLGLLSLALLAIFAITLFANLGLVPLVVIGLAGAVLALIASMQRRSEARARAEPDADRGLTLGDMMAIEGIFYLILCGGGIILLFVVLSVFGFF